MALYQYIKHVPTSRHIRVSKAVSFILMGLGSITLVWVLWPIASFTFFTAPMFRSVISPVVDSRFDAQNTVLSPLVLAAGSDGTGSETSVDYTNANIWYPTKPQKKIVTPVNTYTLSIPKLNITDALVIIAGDDLNKSLIHYGGTGLPGEYGTAVIFGHSVLPQFFSPKNYKSIFSTLPTMAQSDDIVIRYDGIEYRYRVYDIVVTEPNDLSPLEQHFDDSYVTLITCVPPGTYWKRLNVHARLVRPENEI